MSFQQGEVFSHIDYIDKIEEFLAEETIIEEKFKKLQLERKEKLKCFLEEIKEEIKKIKIPLDVLDTCLENYSFFLQNIYEVYDLNKNAADAAENLKIFIDKEIPFANNLSLKKKLESKKMSESDVIFLSSRLSF